MAKGKDKFRGFFPGPHGIYYKTSHRAREQAAAERSKQEQIKYDRFYQSMRWGASLLANPKNKAYWISQAELAFYGPGEWWSNRKYIWENPKDKSVIYAIMLMCIDNSSGFNSGFKIVPEYLRKTKAYKANEGKLYWIQDWALAGEYLSYIEAELQSLPVYAAKSLLDETPEMSLPLGPSKWAEIFGVSVGTIRRWRDNPKSKYHFNKMSDRKWSLPKNEIPTEYLIRYRKNLT